MSFAELFENISEHRRARASKPKTPFTFSKLKQEADKWLSPTVSFEAGNVVTARDMYIPMHYPCAGEVYIVIEAGVKGLYMEDDPSCPFAGIAADVRILRLDSDGDCVPYLIPSRFLRIATDQEIADAEGKLESKICPNCHRDHSKDEGGSNETKVSTCETESLTYPTVPMRINKTTVDEFGELLTGDVNKPLSTSPEEALRVFVNLSMQEIPTHALYKHTHILKQLLMKEFDRVYGMLTPETIATYNDIIVEARDGQM